MSLSIYKCQPCIQTKYIQIEGVTDLQILEYFDTVLPWKSISTATVNARRSKL